MANERPNHNPYSNFNFRVFIPEVGELGFSEVSGLDSENTPIEYREGADPTGAPRQLPGIEKYGRVTLKRGVTGNLKLWNWRQAVRDGGTSFPPSQTVTITLLDEKRNPQMTFTLYDAWPAKLTGPSLNAKGNEIAIEQLELVHERLEIA